MAGVLRILVPVGLSRPSSLALDRAVELATEGACSIDVLYVFDPDAAREAPREAMQRALEALVTPHWSKGVPIQARMATGLPADRILDLARVWGSDLVILEIPGDVATSPEGVAATVLRDAPCPVVTVMIPPEDARAKERHP